uniref:Sugar phosphate isomerase/epimerase n=1 Tax=Schlesneria paludicola TaxID=360056 RepID=A0A7C2K1J7_9PLAN
MSVDVSRRQWLGLTAAAAAAWAVPAAAAPPPSRHGGPFRYCLNTSTIREQKLGIVAEVELVAKAGYDGIEPWIREIDDYVNQGGTLRDLKKRIADAGLAVESAIDFPAFLHEDETQRQKALDAAKRSMDIVRQIGGTRIAAPPAGVTDKTGLDPYALADRYRILCQIGQEMGVVPELELWGFSKTLSRLGEVAFTAIEAAHPAACILLDVYHMYKGGSGIDGLAVFPGHRMYCLHMNDYPADPPRETITDRHRVMPGDGVAPLDKILQTLRDIGYRGALSLELFNADYWKMDAEEVCRIGLDKMRTAVAKALG